MTYSIFCRSYGADFSWLQFLLRSIQKFCWGFDEIVIGIPDKDLRELRSWNLTKEKIVITKDPPGEPYLSQQLMKVYADRYIAGSTTIFVDSDCCFNTLVTPNEFFRDNKPIMLVTPYSVLGTAVPWKPITEKALGFECPFETMRRLPWVFPTDLLPKFREYMQNLHGKPVEQYIMEQPGRAFSEFNALGSWAYHFHPDRFYFLDTTKEELPPTVLKQNWSWGGIKPEIKAELEAILAS